MHRCGGEPDEAQRIAGWKAVDTTIAADGLVLPLLQYVQPVLFKSPLAVAPNMSGALQPATITKTQA